MAALLAVALARRQGLGRCKAQIEPLSRGYVEPEVGFEPTTFRLRVGCSASTWSAPDGSSLLTLDGPSVQTAPDGSRPIVWMIIGMIKAHPTENRMPRQAGPRAGRQLSGRGRPPDPPPASDAFPGRPTLGPTHLHRMRPSERAGAIIDRPEERDARAPLGPTTARHGRRSRPWPLLVETTRSASGAA
jgi:hypothetical protein